MKISSMKHRIKLQKSTYTQDDWGNQRETLVDMGEVWAHVTNLHGQEYFAAATIQNQREVKFIIRFMEGVDEKTTIDFRGVKYNIVFVDNIKYGNEWLEIRANIKKR